MADENVTIRIKINANTSEIDRVRAKLAKLCAEAKACDDTFDRLGKSAGDASDGLDDVGDSAEKSGKQSRRSSKDHDALSKSLKKVGSSADFLSRIMKTSYKFAFIGAGIETVALALALSSVNGLLATGRFLVKSYEVTLAAMAKTAAGAAAALATVAAAQRQYIAAVGSGRYGGNFAASSAALRTMQGDARLAAVGLKGLSSAYAAASKNAKVTGATSSGIAGLMDFAYLSGDAEKGIAAVANLVSLLQSGKAAGSQDLLAAAQEIGPEFEKQYKEVIKGGKTTSNELIQMFSSGEFSKMANVAGTADNVNRTLVGQLKSFMTQIQVMFGDLGMQFIEPVQKAFDEIRRIMVRTFTEISPLVVDFAKGTMIDKIVDLTDKLANFTVKLMQDYVPATQNFFENMRKAWDAIFDGFKRFGGYLRQFSAASKIMNKFLGGIFKAIGGGLKTNFENFAELIVENKKEFLEFGDALENLITKIFDFFRAIREAFMKALPYITTVIDAISTLVKVFGDLIKTMTGLGGFGAFASLVLPFFAGGVIGKKKGKGGGGTGMRGAFGQMSGAKKMGGVAGALASLGILTALPEGDLGDVVNSASSAGLAAMFAPAGYKIPAAMAVGGMSASNAIGANTYRDGFGGIGKENKYVSGAIQGVASGGTAAVTIGAINAGAAAIGSSGVGIPLAAGIIAATTVYGFINGMAQDRKYKNKAKEAAVSFVEGYSTELDQAFANNDIKKAGNLVSDLNFQILKASKTQVKEGTFVTEAQKLMTDQLEKQYKPALKTITSRLKDLTDITGKSEDQMIELANAAGIDLSNGFITLKDILEATGVATARFGKDFNDEMVRTYSQAVADIQKAVDVLEAPRIANETSAAFRSKAIAGTATGSDFGQLLQTLAQEQLIKSGGDATLALLELYKNIGLGGKQFTYEEGGKKGVFNNEAVVAAFAEFKPILDAFFNQGKQGEAQLVSENIVAKLAEVGYKTDLSQKELIEKLSSLPIEKLTEIALKVREKNFVVGEGGSTLGGQGRIFETIPNQIAELLGPDLADLTRNLDIQKTQDQKNVESNNGLRIAINGNFTPGVGKFETAVTSFGEIVNKDLRFAIANPLGPRPPDTMTPRRAAVDALNTHSAFDIQIAGNRNVTSSLRFGNLGSMNSDHAAGRAYDLVGQNLGLYGQAIRNAGGFAEFHGNGGDRHLHVVPPSSSAIGDTASPYMGGVSTTPVSNNTTTVNLVVNASPGQDVRALADEVMYRIEQETRSRNERY